jgi:hypothetical protein
VPSEAHGRGSGKCDFVWVWYRMLPSDTEEYHSVFTDIDGKTHATTIPRGRMRKEVWGNLNEEGQKVLSPPFADLLANTSNPFVSAIRDLTTPQASFYDGRLLLLGDAMVLARPHSALSTNQAALQALALEGAVKGKQGVEAWEREALKGGVANHALSISFGEFCFTGKVPDTVRSIVEKSVQDLEG